MPFTVSYNITANDKFSQKIKAMGKKLDVFKTKLSGIGDTAALDKFATAACKAKTQTTGINKSLGMMDKSIKTDQLKSFNRLLFTTGNIAASAAGKLKSMIPQNMAKYAGKGALIAAAGSGLIGDDELSKMKIRLQPLVGNLNKVTEAISRMRQMSVKTGKSFSEISTAYRLLLEGGFGEKQALKTIPSMTGMSYYTNLPMSEFARMYSKVMQGHGAGEAFSMLLRRGVNLYKPLYSMMHHGAKLSSLAPMARAQQIQMLDAYTSSRAFTLPIFQKVMQRYNNQYMQNMTSRFTTQTYSGAISKLLASFHQISTSALVATGNFLHLHKALATLANATSTIAQSFMKFANKHSTMTALGTLGIGAGAIGLGFKSFKKALGAFKEGESALGKVSNVGKSLIGDAGSAFGLIGRTASLVARAGSPLALALTPSSVGDSTRNKYRAYTTTYDIGTKIPGMYSSSENKSHVKIDVVAHNAQVASVKKRSIQGHNVFDVNALGQNQYRLSQ